MRIIMIGKSEQTGGALAERLGVPLVQDSESAPLQPEGFVLAREPHSVESARELDERLSRIAADIEVAVWFRGDDAEYHQHREILEYYRGRIIEVDLEFTPDPLEGVLYGLHEFLVAG